MRDRQKNLQNPEEEFVPIKEDVLKKAVFLKKMEDSNNTGMTPEEFWAYYIRNLEKEEKISQEEFFLLTVTGNLVVGERIQGAAKIKIYLNLDKGTYTENYEFNGKHLSEFHYICNSN